MLALLLGRVGLALLAPRLGVPWPALLALTGAALASVPGAPRGGAGPELALALFVAPVLLDAEFDASPPTCATTGPRSAASPSWPWA